MFPIEDSRYTNQPRFSTMPVRANLNPGFGNNRIIPTFSHGGRVQGMRELAEMLRHHGEGEDKILAHINIDEARQLGKQHGFSGNNPITGLPQFGGKKRRGVKKLFHAVSHGSKHNILGKVHNAVSRPLTHPRKALPTIGAALGSMILPGAGTLMGGGLGGALSGRRDAQGKNNIFKNALKGLGTGALMGGAGSLIGGGGIPGISGPLSGGPAGGGMFSGLSNIGSSISGLLGGGGGTPGEAPGGGGIGGILGKLGISPLEALLGAGALYGMSKSKLKEPKAASRDQIPDFMRPEPQQERKKVKFVDRRYVPLPDDWNPETDPEHMFYQPYDEEVPQGYSQGGFLDGHTDGQADEIPARLSDGEYVLSADVVSGLGSGSSAAGAKIMDDFVKRVRAHRSKNGSKLAPKAKSLSAYGLKMARR